MTDPRKSPAPLAEVPALFAKGAGLLDAGRYWDAHEAWEDAWHALRAARRAEEAAFLRGLILVAAAWENLGRGKTEGFRRQGAKALVELRAHAGRGAGLGMRDEAGFVGGVLDAYLENAAKTDAASAPRRPPSLGRK